MEATGVKISGELYLKSDAGSIVVDCFFEHEGSATLKTSAGTLRGKLLNYKALNASSDIGIISLDLSPDADALTHVKSDVGSVTTNMFGFRGKFSARSDVGTLSVQGDDVVIESETGGKFGFLENKKSGYVGKGLGIVSISTDVGAATLNFK